MIKSINCKNHEDFRPVKTSEPKEAKDLDLCKLNGEEKRAIINRSFIEVSKLKTSYILEAGKCPWTYLERSNCPFYEKV